MRGNDKQRYRPYCKYCRRSALADRQCSNRMSMGKQYVEIMLAAPHIAWPLVERRCVLATRMCRAVVASLGGEVVVDQACLSRSMMGRCLLIASWHSREGASGPVVGQRQRPAHHRPHLDSHTPSLCAVLEVANCCRLSCRACESSLLILVVQP